MKTWRPPARLYASYRSFLFETQALFLDIAQQEQVRDFIGFLGVGIEPTPDLVVKHLLACAKASREVNQQVYNFLNIHVDNPAIRQLQNEKCLLLEGGYYVRPDQVFWGEHRFGRHRFRLNQDLRVYTKLFDRLGVRESPEVSDAIRVLLEISDEFGAVNQPLDEEAYGVLLQCWALLSAALEQNVIAEEQLTTLRPRKVIPDDCRVLNRPERIFFEDRPGLTIKFGDFLKHNAIRRPEDAWLAMEAVGVSPLSKAVRTNLVERSDAILDESVMARIRERRDLIARVVTPHRVGTESNRSLELLERVRAERTGHLKVNYTIEVFGQLQTTLPEAVAAYYDTDGEVLYFQQRDPFPWPAIARELAYALDPKAEGGQIAPGLKEVLSADSFAEANTNLDELGFAPLESLATSPVPVGEQVGLGGSEAPLANGGDFSSTIGSEKAEPPGPMTPADAVQALLGSKASAPTPLPPDLNQPESVGRRGGSGNDVSSISERGKETSTRQRSRLRTYVAPKNAKSDSTEDSAVTAHRNRVERAGVDRVLEFERRAGRRPQEMPSTHPGYDIESANAAGEIVRYIEVKSLGGDWDKVGAGLSDTQFVKAQELGEKYWLYVVERAEDDANIFRIQNPARQVSQFFYDDGWRGLSEEENAAMPTAGPRMTQEDEERHGQD